MLRWLLAVLAASTIGCGREDAEGWARDKLGDDAESLRRESMDAYERTWMVPGGLQPEPGAYLPRPAVVLEPPPKMGETRHLRYHRVNPKLDEAIQSKADVKGIAVVTYGIWDASRFERTKTGHVAWIPDGQPFISVVAIDRETKQGKLHIMPGDGDAEVAKVINALPARAP